MIERLRNNELVGLNVTIPYKKMFQLVDKVSKTARISEAVNTVYIKDKNIIGDNTDGEGFILSVKKIKDFRFENLKVLILECRWCKLWDNCSVDKKRYKKNYHCKQDYRKSCYIEKSF